MCVVGALNGSRSRSAARRRGFLRAGTSDPCTHPRRPARNRVRREVVTPLPGPGRTRPNRDPATSAQDRPTHRDDGAESPTSLGTGGRVHPSAASAERPAHLGHRQPDVGRQVGRGYEDLRVRWSFRVIRPHAGGRRFDRVADGHASHWSTQPVLSSRPEPPGRLRRRVPTLEHPRPHEERLPAADPNVEVHGRNIGPEAQLRHAVAQAAILRLGAIPQSLRTRIGRTGHPRAF